MADFHLSGFVADDGTTIGIAVLTDNTVLRAVALGRLDTPVDITTWVRALSMHPHPDAAASELLSIHGGDAIFQPINLEVAVVLPHLNPAQPVAEA